MSTAELESVVGGKVDLSPNGGKVDLSPNGGKVDLSPNDGVAKLVTLQNDSQSFLMNVDQLDTTYFENPRKNVRGGHIDTLENSINQNGLLQPVVLGRKPDGTFAVFAGWCRTEAFRRMVYRPLIDKYNKENGLPYEERLFLNNLDDCQTAAMAYPEDHRKHLQDKMIRVTIDNDAKDSDCYQKSVAENNDREDLTLSEKLDAIETMITKFNMKAGHVAKKIFRISEPKLSQMRKCTRMLNKIGELLAKPSDGEQFTEQQISDLQQDAELIVQELHHRIDIPKGNEGFNLSVSFSHLRELSGVILEDDAGESKLSRARAFDLVSSLVGWNVKARKFKSPDSEGHSKEEAKIYGIFKEEIEGGVKETAAERDAKKNPPPQAPVSPSIDSLVEGAATGTVSGLAIQQISAAIPPTAADTAAELNAGVVVGGVDISSLDDDDTEPTPTAVNDGMKSGKTSVAPIYTAYKLKSTELIKDMISTYQESLKLQISAHDEGDLAIRRRGDLITSMAAIAILWDILGEKKKSAEMNGKVDEYSELLELYFQEIEAKINTAVSDKSKGFSGYNLKDQEPALDLPIAVLDLDSIELSSIEGEEEGYEEEDDEDDEDEDDDSPDVDWGENDDDEDDEDEEEEDD